MSLPSPDDAPRRIAAAIGAAVRRGETIPAPLAAAWANTPANVLAALVDQALDALAGADEPRWDGRVRGDEGIDAAEGLDATNVEGSDDLERAIESAEELAAALAAARPGLRRFLPFAKAHRRLNDALHRILAVTERSSASEPTDGWGLADAVIRAYVRFGTAAEVVEDMAERDEGFRAELRAEVEVAIAADSKPALRAHAVAFGLRPGAWAAQRATQDGGAVVPFGRAMELKLEGAGGRVFARLFDPGRELPAAPRLEWASSRRHADAPLHPSGDGLYANPFVAPDALVADFLGLTHGPTRWLPRSP